MPKQKNTKGEITTQQLVLLIVLIVSFVIILFLLFRLNLGGTTNAEICRNSVVLKGRSSLTSGPITCKTDYLCISGGQSCNNFQASETVKIDPSNKTQIMKSIADSMSNCWFEFGEGKIDYGEGVTRVDYAICSIISFDSSIKQKISGISYQDFYTYLEKNKKDDTYTYLQYLYGITSPSLLQTQSQIKVDISSDQILTNQEYSVITGVDNNLPIINKDRILGVYIIPTVETSSRLVSNGNFITTA